MILLLICLSSLALAQETAAATEQSISAWTMGAVAVVLLVTLWLRLAAWLRGRLSPTLDALRSAIDELQAAQPVLRAVPAFDPGQALSPVDRWLEAGAVHAARPTELIDTVRQLLLPGRGAVVLGVGTTLRQAVISAARSGSLGAPSAVARLQLAASASELARDMAGIEADLARVASPVCLVLELADQSETIDVIVSKAATLLEGREAVVVLITDGQVQPPVRVRVERSEDPTDAPAAPAMPRDGGIDGAA